ncbi:hypothetical protein G6F56_013679 [Rhizopus delemar]|nr:hypothetical protein G6F56_013679 [Rhizopus delemar]
MGASTNSMSSTVMQVGVYEGDRVSTNELTPNFHRACLERVGEALQQKVSRGGIIRQLGQQAFLIESQQVGVDGFPGGIHMNMRELKQFFEWLIHKSALAAVVGQKLITKHLRSN